MDTLWPQVAAKTLAEQVYQIIRARIIQSELPPGSFIREQEVSEATGVSRTPVREALNRLSTEGFLTRIPHRGFKVPDEPWEALLEVYPIVAVLDVLSGNLSVRRFEPADIERLKGINAELKKAGERRDVGALVTLNNSFHQIFSERSGNARLTELLDQLRAQLIVLDLWYYSVPKHSVHSYEDHEEIIGALERGDYDRAVAVLETNYARSRTALLEERESIAKRGGVGRLLDSIVAEPAESRSR